MLTIRFNRTGKRNTAYFRIVLQEHTVAPGGRHVEVLGSWDPHMKKGVFKNDKIKYWIEKGAQVSDSVWNLLIKNNVIEGKTRAIKIKKAEKPAEVAKEEAPKESASAPADAKAMAGEEATADKEAKPEAEAKPDTAEAKTGKEEAVDKK